MVENLFETNLESKVTLETESKPLPEDMPFRILLLGDWAGNSAFSTINLVERRPVEIDRDDFDAIMRKISPEISLRFQGNENNPLNLKFENLEDFHPDNIFQKLPLFADLKEVRQKLKKSETFDEAAREVRSWYADSLSDTSLKNDSQELIASSSGDFEPGNLLDQILDNKKSENPVKQTIPKSELSEFVGNIIAPHIVKTDLEEQSKLLAIVDEVISDLMRKILHHEDFQKLEAAWRGLYFLVRRIDTDNTLNITFVQMTKTELLDNLSSVNNLSESVLYNLVNENSTVSNEGSPWAIICGNYHFNSTVEDTAALMRISKIAETGNSPFISSLNPNIFGMNSFSEFTQHNWKVSEESSEYKLWSALRSLPESSYLGLAMPRFIGRFPYGYATEPTEAFSFEEFIDTPVHQNYLWINPAFAYVYALAQEYLRNEWNIEQNTAFDLEDLPLHLYKSEDSTKTKPCAETELSETVYNSIINQGIMTLISFRDSDKVRLSALRSISANTSSLNGKWSV